MLKHALSLGESPLGWLFACHWRYPLFLTFFLVFSLPHRVLELQTFVNVLGDICSFDHGLSHCISPFLSPSVSGSSEVSLPVLFIYTYLCGCHIIQVQR